MVTSNLCDDTLCVLGSLENKLRQLVGAGKPAKWLKFFHVAHDT